MVNVLERDQTSHNYKPWRLSLDMFHCTCKKSDCYTLLIMVNVLERDQISHDYKAIF